MGGWRGGYRSRGGAPPHRGGRAGGSRGARGVPQAQGRGAALPARGTPLAWVAPPATADLPATATSHAPYWGDAPPEHSVPQAQGGSSNAEMIAHQQARYQATRTRFGGINFQRNQSDGIKVKDGLRSSSQPVPGEDISEGAGQLLARMVHARDESGFGEVQCAVTGNSSSGERRYILSANGNRHKLIQVLDNIGRNPDQIRRGLSSGVQPSRRLTEVFNAIEEGRVTVIDHDAALEIYNVGLTEASKVRDTRHIDGVHAETFFLESEDILKRRGILERDHEIQAVVGVRRPCLDCVHAFLIALRAQWIASRSVEARADAARPPVPEGVAQPATAGDEIPHNSGGSMEAANRRINAGKGDGSGNPRLGYDAVLRRVRLSGNLDEALTRISSRLNIINPFRYYGDPTKADATPRLSPLDSGLTVPQSAPQVASADWGIEAEAFPQSSTPTFFSSVARRSSFSTSSVEEEAEAASFDVAE